MPPAVSLEFAPVCVSSQGGPVKAAGNQFATLGAIVITIPEREGRRGGGGERRVVRSRPTVREDAGQTLRAWQTPGFLCAVT